jgi:hypothetical protein
MVQQLPGQPSANGTQAAADDTAWSNARQSEFFAEALSFDWEGAAAAGAVVGVVDSGADVSPAACDVECPDAAPVGPSDPPDEVPLPLRA